MFKNTVVVRLKTKEDIAILKEGGRRLAELLKLLAENTKPGVSSADLDKIANDFIAKNGDKAAFLGYKGKYDKEAYPAAICVSVNDEVVHGEPTRTPRVFKEGDIVSLDAGIIHKGLYTDAAITVPVGKISETAKKLIEVTRKSLQKGIMAAEAGKTTGDIGWTIEKFINSQGDYGIVRELAGHGVGFDVHEDPFVPNYGKKGSGIRLEPGLVIAIEPMVNAGSEKIFLDNNGHTYKTTDHSLSAHFEHTIAITEKGPIILTLP